MAGDVATPRDFARRINRMTERKFLTRTPTPASPPWWTFEANASIRDRWARAVWRVSCGITVKSMIISYGSVFRFDDREEKSRFLSQVEINEISRSQRLKREIFSLGNFTNFVTRLWTSDNNYRNISFHRFKHSKLYRPNANFSQSLVVQLSKCQ